MGKRNAVALRKSDIKDLEPRAQTYRVNDLDVNGLALQVTPGGAKSWVLRFRDAAGGQKTITLGHWPEVGVDEARRRATSAKAKVSDGIPLITKRSAKPKAGAKVTTLGDVAEDFYRDWVLVKNMPSYQHYQRWALDKHVLPILRDLPIKDITPQVVSRFLGTLAGTPTTENRVKSLMSKMMNWARRRYEELEHTLNPVQGHEHHEEVAREARMTPDEIRDLGERYRVSQDPLRHAVLFCLLTGCRAGAVLVQTEANRFPDESLLRFDVKTPGLKKCRAVYMPKVAVALLSDVPCSIARGPLWRSWVRLRGHELTYTIHDLRRTFASIGADLGHDEAVVDALLGHSRGKIRGTYIRRADPTLLAVAEDIGTHIAVLLGLAKPVKAKPRKPA